MYRFFVDKNQIGEDKVFIVGSDYNHIKNVLRMREGEEISVMALGDDNEYRCEIAGYTEDSVECRLMFTKLSDVELPCNITLFQALPKSDKMELIIQKAVELGAASVVPVATSRAVVKLEGAKEDKKITRWNAIAEAAAKQAKRAIIPKVESVVSFKEAMKRCENMDVKLIPYELSDPDSMEKTRGIVRSIKEGDNIAIFIGPEGGFTPEEVELAIANDCEPITLGHRILRTETAGFVVLSWLLLQMEK